MILAQCPCSGSGGGGGCSALPLVVMLAIVLGGYFLLNGIASTCEKEGVSTMNKAGRIAVVVALVVVVAVVLAVKKGKAPPSAGQRGVVPSTPAGAPSEGGEARPASTRLPRLVDLGRGVCIPCKMMAPILEELQEEYAGRAVIEIVDIGEHPGEATKYKIRVIPTQIFINSEGKEVFRHEGFMPKEDIEAKLKEMGVAAATPEPAPEAAEAPTFERLEPAKADTRPKDQICYMCDGDIRAKSLVVVQTEKGAVRLCGPHCYFIIYSCLTEGKEGFEDKVTVTDWATGERLPATGAVYLYDFEEDGGRPTIKAFANKGAAKKEQQSAGGTIVTWAILQNKELTTRCGFCDRACYPEDAARVICGGVHTWGCCSHCAMGVAARTGFDIKVHQPDRLTGEMVVVKTRDGKVASLEPKAAVAWFGMRKKPDGKFGSAGCFHQGFFVNEANLKKWAEQNPTETGRMIAIRKALADKMRLTPQQISKACKIGECAPK